MNKILINEEFSCYVGVRVDKALSEIFKEEQSRSKIVSLIESGKVLINQNLCKTSTKLKINDEISYDFSEEEVVTNIDFKKFFIYIPPKIPL